MTTREPGRSLDGQGNGPGSGTGPEVVLVVRDRPDALERVFGTVRRRAMDLQVLSLGRFGEELVIVLRRDAPGSLPGRWLAELEDLVDVREIRVTSPLRSRNEGRSSPPDSTFQGDRSHE